MSNSLQHTYSYLILYNTLIRLLILYNTLILHNILHVLIISQLWQVEMSALASSGPQSEKLLSTSHMSHM